MEIEQSHHSYEWWEQRCLLTLTLLNGQSKVDYTLNTQA